MSSRIVPPAACGGVLSADMKETGKTLEGRRRADMEVYRQPDRLAMPEAKERQERGENDAERKDQQYRQTRIGEWPNE